MAKAVDLLSYWIPELRNLKEFKEIAKAETPELEYLLEACESVLNNMYISTADESGIERYEKIMGIIPDGEQMLESRRFNVLLKWNDNTIYTDETLESLLTSICGGADRFSITRDYENYKIAITTTVSIAGAYEVVAKFLEDILPCNLEIALTNNMEITVEAPIYVGMATCSSIAYQKITGE